MIVSMFKHRKLQKLFLIEIEKLTKNRKIMGGKLNTKSYINHNSQHHPFTL